MDRLGSAAQPQPPAPAPRQDARIAARSEFIASAEGNALARAFTQISNATLRRTIFRMVEGTVDHL